MATKRETLAALWDSFCEWTERVIRVKHGGTQWDTVDCPLCDLGRGGEGCTPCPLVKYGMACYSGEDGTPYFDVEQGSEGPDRAYPECIIMATVLYLLYEVVKSEAKR